MNAFAISYTQYQFGVQHIEQLCLPNQRISIHIHIVQYLTTFNIYSYSYGIDIMLEL